jgi:hypothetical protein
VERTGDSDAWGTASVCKKVTGEPAPKAPLSAAVLFFFYRQQKTVVLRAKLCYAERENRRCKAKVARLLCKNFPMQLTVGGKCGPILAE